MAVNNNNSPIPKEAIEGAAGINDKFSVNGLEFDQEKGQIKVSKKVKREAPLSTELAAGMIIKASTSRTSENIEK